MRVFGVDKAMMGEERRGGEERGLDLVGELWDDVGHLVDVDELDPRLEVLVVVLPHELGVRGPAEVRRHALVALLDEDAAPLHAQVRLVQPELPAGQRLPVPAARLLRYVELEPGPIEPDRLPDRLDVRRLEREQDAQPAQHDLVAEVRREERHLEPRELKGRRWGVRMCVCSRHRQGPRGACRCGRERVLHTLCDKDSTYAETVASRGSTATCLMPRPMLTTSRCLPWTMTIPTRELSHARW